jgi:tetratricopeptide (TPR) repeat protein
MAETLSETDLPHQVKTLWLKGISAVETHNHAFAVVLLQAVLKDAPGFLEGRKVLRKCEIQMTGGSRKKAGLFGSRGGGLPLMKLQSQAKKDPEGTLVALEKELEKDPFHEQVNDLMFDIFMRMNLLDSAAFALETVRRGHPENTRLLHKLAEYYLARDMPQEASDVYADIVKQDPPDSAAIKGTKDSIARASMKKQGWETSSDMRDLMRNSGESADLEKANRAAMTRDQLEEKRDALIARYEADPNQLVVVKDLAQVFEQLEDWPHSATFYSWAHSLSNGDVALQRRAATMKDKASDFEIKELERAVSEQPNDLAAKEKLDAIKAERLTLQVSERKARVDQNPTDPQLRFELGQALYNIGDHSAAIPHLQQAKQNPHIRTRVLLLLGRTFRAKGMFDLALKQLSDALADMSAGMDPTKKEILYEKGLIHAETGDHAAALNAFKSIYEVDYGYRDVADRVEKSYS